MSDEPAWRSEELDLSEVEKTCAASMYRQFGPVPAAELIMTLERAGYRVEGVLETAYMCPLEDFRRVEAAFKRLPEQPRPKIRRKR